VAFSGATAGGIRRVHADGANALLVLHKITGATSGGYVSLSLLAGGVSVPHHGRGTNIKSAATPTSYAALFEGVTDEVEVVLNVTDGTHDVVVVPLVV
jgi:hypothetical protein